MKIYAELIGNYKIYWIKSQLGNILMAELADEELHDISPRIVEEETFDFLDIGYYTDEYGIKRYGIIPSNHRKFETKVNNNWIEQNNFRRTSDPRYR